MDTGVLPKILGEAVKGGKVDLGDVKTTMELLKADAIVGVAGRFNGDKLVSIGITCAIRHSTVNDSIMKGAGNRTQKKANEPQHGPSKDARSAEKKTADKSAWEKLKGFVKPSAK